MLGQARLLEAKDASPIAAMGEQPASPPRLLVIDDDTLHRMVMCRVAAKAGYIPAGAPTYEEAAKLAQANVFDCITLDLSLGRHVCVEMLHHLRVIDSRAPIVIISACDDATCREILRVAGSLKLNVGEPVPKPVDLAMLRYSLEQMRIQRALACGNAAV
jgi:two-component system, chemotaxis family, chemotaxis protein CheY